MFEKIKGQKPIIKELSSIISDVKINKSSVNILLRGMAGSGKTAIAEEFMRNVCGTRFYSKQLPDENGKLKYRIDEKIRYYLIDEVHLLKDFEFLYPYMDSNKFVFVFASNEYGNLPEAFTSRCIVFSLFPYGVDELSDIVMEYAEETGMDFISRKDAIIIAKSSRGSPRTAQLLTKRISFILRNGYYGNNSRGVNAALKDIGIYDGGYTEFDIKYLKFLSKVGKASLDVISNSVHIDKTTIRNEIEPFLLDKGHIIIQSSGRRFNSWMSLHIKE